ncbi:unannotated protein [freshwater metagenome]|uniref:Unannotated protein n=1 Tax=freshwater metagenome TaxID=449393 RepID=A0A6J7BWV8_9ZZZZ|nr:SDR family oxidoreductase [Actinomycetota bacterium]
MTTANQGAAAGGQRVAVVTHVTEYAGPGSDRALADAGYVVACHDQTFIDPQTRAQFSAANVGLLAMEQQSPHDLAAAVITAFGRIDVVVSNDFIPGSHFDPTPETRPPGTPSLRAQRLEDMDVVEFRATLEELVIRPFLLAQNVIGAMKERGSGTLIFITSAASYRAGPNIEMYGAARSATTALAQGLAVEVAPFNIQVNPIGPAWFANPTYFPERLSEEWMPAVAREVPLGRLSRQDELGALVVFLASGQALPLTGQFLPFTAGTRLRR